MVTMAKPIFLFLAMVQKHALAYEILEEADMIQRVSKGEVDVLLDVRTPKEWDAGHVPNAYFKHFHSDEEPQFDVSELAGCEKCRIITYCHSGFRANIAAGMLEKAGFTSVADGLGVKQWTEAGATLVNTASKPPSCLGTGICTPLPPFEQSLVAQKRPALRSYGYAAGAAIGLALMMAVAVTKRASRQSEQGTSPIAQPPMI